MKTSSPALKYLLEKDVQLSKYFVVAVSNSTFFKSLKIHSRFLEISCDGIAWFASWIAFIYMFSSKNLYQMQVNMLFGLILDVVIVAVLKALVRRRRPVASKDMLTIGPDVFSFPSGHASRAFFVLLFFTKLYPVHFIFMMPVTAWAVSVAISRLILQRHYILDICAGAVIGVLEALIVGLFWISEQSAFNIVGFVSNENVESTAE
ncbi:polyisoprenoid diphosphate/phosphate phosphohydrolase PLPP6 [Drosophila bipectinata]|uniref:polyisoprenoid diphosphate/phosphate phosphohydrolase PLPP6 n=1 Tax=Drosophila bipectinata TaxID=42026 RepID=UPI001C8A69EF|nr:phospholipid phosphatase 6 [Drosophila bipectinata]